MGVKNFFNRIFGFNNWDHGHSFRVVSIEIEHRDIFTPTCSCGHSGIPSAKIYYETGLECRCGVCNKVLPWCYIDKVGIEKIQAEDKE